MPTTRTISNTDDIIDSRDVIERLRELESERESAGTCEHCGASGVIGEECVECEPQGSGTGEPAVGIKQETRNFSYRISYYGPDGTGGSVHNPTAIHGREFDTLGDARAAIRNELGGRGYGTWDGNVDDSPPRAVIFKPSETANWITIECWHESGHEGCGYCIERRAVKVTTIREVLP